MTALHIMASSRKVFEIDFSRAYVKLFPSAENGMLSNHNIARGCILTNHQCKVFQFARVALILNGRETFGYKLFCGLGGFFIDDDLSLKRKGLYWEQVTICRHTKFIDSDMSLHDIPMLIAVSCLSPVRTQTYTSMKFSNCCGVH